MARILRDIVPLSDWLEFSVAMASVASPIN